MKTTLAIAVLASTLLSAAPAAIILSEIDLVGNKVEIVNTGPANVDLTGYWLCNRLNGSPFYQAITTGLIDLPNSTDGNLQLAAGDVMTLQLTASFIPDASGEVGLYLNNSGYGNAANIVDYVGWGADGQRDSVAATAGIWTSGTFVNVSGITAGQTVQLAFGQPGNSATQYQLRPSTIGVAQSVPEPSSIALALIGGVALLNRRNRRAARSN
jgi:hypothetical protein